MQYKVWIHMPIGERRKREKEQREKEIIDAAERLFIAKGFEGTSMDDIAAAVELSKPAIYRYFTNKEDLYFAVACRALDTVTAMMVKYVGEGRTGLDKAHSTGRAFYDFYRKYPDQYRILMNAQYIGGAGGKSPYQKRMAETSGINMKLMCDAIDMGKKDGTIRKDFDTLMAAIFFIQSLGTALEISGGNKKLLGLTGKSQDDFVSHSMDLMLHSIKKDA